MKMKNCSENNMTAHLKAVQEKKRMKKRICYKFLWMKKKIEKKNVWERNNELLT